ncbi:hypothetical protein [Pseudidiomarina aestuarii]|nr:hypothetical protein [Pseudidiomarina aestuarii]
MSHDENFKDQSTSAVGWIAVILFVAVPLLPAVLAWAKIISA